MYGIRRANSKQTREKHAVALAILQPRMQKMRGNANARCVRTLTLDAGTPGHAGAVWIPRWNLVEHACCAGLPNA
jgi:hypothetical protein